MLCLVFSWNSLSGDVCFLCAELQNLISSDDEDDDEDDTEALLEELARIKKERAEEKLRKVSYSRMYHSFSLLSLHIFFKLCDGIYEIE